MELASGRIRYEFSGPGAYGWYAAFTPSGDAFLASMIFGRSVQVWPTAHKSENGRTPPKPRGTVAAPKRMILDGTVSARGHVAFATDDGGVHLRALEGSAPTLAPLPGKRTSVIAFDRAGHHLAGIRQGKLYVWHLAP